MSIPRDPYLLIAKNADDRTLLNMLSVDKKMSNISDSFIEGVMRERYPLLVRHKLNWESWRSFYARMIYYIALIQEKFGIPYIPHPDFDPIVYHRLLNTHHNYAIHEGFRLSADIGNKSLVDLFLSKGATGVNTGLRVAATSGNKDMVIYLIQKGADDFHNALYYASENGHDDIVKYLLETHQNNLDTNIINAALHVASKVGDKNIVIMLLDNGATGIQDAINTALWYDHNEIVQLLRNYRN